MSHRSYLFSLRIGHALRECLAEGYSFSAFKLDLLAGITVGIIAIPLAMALAIASGVPPQYGLYTAVIAGFLIALTGGSRYSISGPTAAFVVILYPVAQSYGLAGLLLATILSGVMLIVMAAMRFGRFIEYIPEAVTLGFTSGIAVVIATLQIKDVFGLPIDKMSEHYLEKLQQLSFALPDLHWPSLLVAVVTLAVMWLWPKLKLPLPPHLPAIVVATTLALALAHFGLELDTIGSRFSYLLPDGSQGQGIPAVLPEFTWPWLQAGPDGQALEFSTQMVKDLLAAAFAMAMLGAIESLLCAVVLDGMTGRRHSANSELLGQGIGNIVAPFLGGFTATAALARSAANVRAGAQSPVAAMIHALVVLLALLVLAPVLAYLPMAAMAALLLVVAWNMSEAPKAVHLLKTAPRNDIIIFLICFGCTVLFDMVIAISCGMVIAAFFFVKQVADMTRVADISHNRKYLTEPLPEGWKAFRVSGPLFFAAADRVFGELSVKLKQQQGAILVMDAVTLMDAGGLSAFTKLVSLAEKQGTHLLVTDLTFQPLKTLAKAKVQPLPGILSFYSTLADALNSLPGQNIDPQDEAVGL
ncbi:C4-dicarboxylic acid transporter DauA [Rheinheimera faecalis]|uniref:C4-dicarboxylic acid transporter DauA n=1 Tax=Rheinheimera faecalis TaxID=2901141 RepID=UPI001E5E8868|nr:C4-dicarboxylic acid transporter DauA [Rheinheimera faecalis]